MTCCRKGLLLLICACSVVVSHGTEDPFIWPLPSSYTSGTTTLKVDARRFHFVAPYPSADLDKTIARYSDLIFSHLPHPGKLQEGLSELVVNVTDGHFFEPLQLGVNETYTLEVPTGSDTATLTATTFYGALRGLETFSQLVVFDFDTKEVPSLTPSSVPASVLLRAQYVISNAPWSINDRPRFAHRGVMLDTARHFESMAALRSFVTAASYAKLNTLHWCDLRDVSFPFEGVSYPELASKGAFSSVERYSVEDVADFVEYARLRGVRVMIETDMPGHAGSFCAGHPEVCPRANCEQPLNVANNATFTVIEGLFRDLTGGKKRSGLVSEDFFHLGGDEVDLSCWMSTPSVANWLKALALNLNLILTPNDCVTQQRSMTAEDGYLYFVKRVQDMIRGMGRTPVAWEEVWKHFGTQLPKDTVIHEWLPGSRIAANVTSHGYRLIFSKANVWYLTGPHVKLMWPVMYSADPCDDGVTEQDCADYVLGGEGAVWGETVDISDLESTTWPRMAAIAERLWSPRSVTSLSAAEPRIAQFRCLLNERGITAAPFNNSVAHSAPPGPGRCRDQ